MGRWLAFQRGPFCCVWGAIENRVRRSASPTSRPEALRGYEVARKVSKVTRFGGNIDWIRDYGGAVAGTSCVARAALQLHSIKRRSRCTAVFPGVSVLSKPTPALSKCLKLKCRVTSQAGRRRFESGLPLHVFNYLHISNRYPELRNGVQRPRKQGSSDL